MVERPLWEREAAGSNPVAPTTGPTDPDPRSRTRLGAAEPEENELAVLEEYLPEQMSEDDVRRVVGEVVAAMGDVTMQQMGQVIGAVKAKVGNAANGAMVAKLVKETIAN